MESRLLARRRLCEGGAAADDAVTAAALAGLMQLIRSHRGDLTAPFSGSLPSPYPPGMPRSFASENVLAISPRCSASNCMSPA